MQIKSSPVSQSSPVTSSKDVFVFFLFFQPVSFSTRCLQSMWWLRLETRKKWNFGEWMKHAVQYRRYELVLVTCYLTIYLPNHNKHQQTLTSILFFCTRNVLDLQKRVYMKVWWKRETINIKQSIPINSKTYLKSTTTKSVQVLMKVEMIQAHTLINSISSTNFKHQQTATKFVFVCVNGKWPCLQ